MMNAVTIVWCVLFLISGMGLLFLLKKRQRKLGKIDMIVKLITVVLCFGMSFVSFYFTEGNPQLRIGITRLTLLILGSGTVITMYLQSWSIRNLLDFSKDSFAVEFLYILNMSFLSSIAFLAAPYTFRLVPYSQDIVTLYWDAPLICIIPFVFIKILDFAGHTPLRMVEKPYIFPLEQVNHHDWKWRGMRQVNFALKSSLVEEYDLFSWNSRPWIEAPTERRLGEVFHLCIQERRKKSNLSTIQDMGDEYGGTPEFYWLFYIKPLWYKPNTWFRKDRYLNPALSIEQNKISKDDIIVAIRISGGGGTNSTDIYDQVEEDEGEKTVFINR